MGLMSLDVPVENPVETVLNVADYERLAEQKLEPGAYGYFAGGAGDEVTLRENVAAFQRLRLRPRVLADVSGIATSATVLGHDVSMPILVAPVAFQRLAHPDGEVATARAAGASRPSSSMNCWRSSRRTSPSVSARIVADRGSSTRPGWWLYQ
jgi:isopentenyl diphosphate isomerase/L-lactate dehydrogenase-like FMN-dependent dehydrogenase